MDVRGATDVAGMRFEIQGVDCKSGTPSGAPQVIQKALEDLQIPNDVPALANMPLDANSSHVFADAFLVLAPGCYDVTTTPVNGKGETSMDCASAHLSKVEIKPEKTTEVFLINQCKGDPKGAIDIASALNHPPVIQGVMFRDSKFVTRCTPQTVCATAVDSDSDPIEWNWEVVDGPAHAGPIVISTTSDKDGVVTQCIQVEGQEQGKLDITLTVYDLVSPGGTPERVEQWLAEQGYPGKSRAALTFPVYVSNTGRTPSEEICDGIDNDCDLQTDEGLTEDKDGDGYTSADSCFGSSDDCDDGDKNVHPGAEEICDKVDNNCNKEVDEGGVCKGDPECTGQTCATFTACNEGGSCSSSGVCGSTSEGGGRCVDGNTSCGGLTACPNGEGDCAAGDACIVGSCCGSPVCVPQARFCSDPSAQAPARARFEAPDAPMSQDNGPTLGNK